jgi:hypothetical protein
MALTENKAKRQAAEIYVEREKDLALVYHRLTGARSRARDAADALDLAIKSDVGSEVIDAAIVKLKADAEYSQLEGLLIQAKVAVECAHSAAIKFYGGH